ncbi:MAG TPA: metallophosphoesterase [Sedimentisphaerales bacterium]|nr:metallophosphoesterase [Sedimentisphaerales bacterium]
MPQTIIDLLAEGAEANLADKFREGNLIQLPGEGSLVITGDIHGHRRNFERITAFADLANNPERHVVLQEIIHGGPEDSEGRCLSYKLLFDAVRYKLDFPDRIHIMMGNHDIAFINNSEVVKNGKEMNRSLQAALDGEFQQDSAEVKVAIDRLLFSQPLAVKCDNRMWLSHSLPSDRFVEEFDKQVLHRPLNHTDVVKPGSAYLLIWGRKHSQAMLDKMAELLDVDIFILGHQAQEQGWCRAGENLIIMASDHNHGCLLPIDLAKSYTVEQLIDCIVPLTSIL